MSTPDTNALKPCPFCGGAVELVQSGKDRLDIKCPGCGVPLYRQRWMYLGRDGLTQRMTEKWNTRVCDEQTLRTLSDENEKLKEWKKFHQHRDSL